MCVCVCVCVCVSPLAKLQNLLLYRQGSATLAISTRNATWLQRATYPFVRTDCSVLAACANVCRRRNVELRGLLGCLCSGRHYRTDTIQMKLAKIIIIMKQPRPSKRGYGCGVRVRVGSGWVQVCVRACACVCVRIALIKCKSKTQKSNQRDQGDGERELEVQWHVRPYLRLGRISLCAHGVNGRCRLHQLHTTRTHARRDVHKPNEIQKKRPQWYAEKPMHRTYAKERHA